MATSFLSLGKPLGSSYAVDPGDTLTAKGALRRLGCYTTPKYGFNQYPDTPLFEGMKNVQKDIGLTPDGVAKPGGRTERAVNQAMTGWFARIGRLH